jgi:hypothetical protein
MRVEYRPVANLSLKNAAAFFSWVADLSAIDWQFDFGGHFGTVNRQDICDFGSLIVK